MYYMTIYFLYIVPSNFPGQVKVVCFINLLSPAVVNESTNENPVVHSRYSSSIPALCHKKAILFSRQNCWLEIRLKIFRDQ